MYHDHKNMYHVQEKIMIESSLQNTLPENLYKSAYPYFLSLVISLRYTTHTNEIKKYIKNKQRNSTIENYAKKLWILQSGLGSLQYYFFLSHTGLESLN